jgi:hypothetical protein
MYGTAAVDGDRRSGPTASDQGVGETSKERVDMPAADTWVRFRCSCGRSVATPADSDAADRRLCSRCRERVAYADGTLRREA